MDRKASRGADLKTDVDILDVRVSAVNMDMAVDRIRSWIDIGESQYVCVTGVHGVIESQDDEMLRGIHNKAGMVTPDGMPLVWCARSAGADWVERVYGPDLLLRVCEESVERGWSHFFYGAGPGVAERLAENLATKFPGLKVAGTYTPPFRDLTEEEKVETVELLNHSGADIVWVGLSTPKQERWMNEFRSKLTASTLVGVGAAFDIHAGELRQAPRWMQRSGLEWAFRLTMEPRRLWRRYFKANPRFVWSIVRRRPRLTGVVD